MKAGINMGETFVRINVSLDGYIERENHDIEWQFVDDDFEESPRHICRYAPAGQRRIGHSALLGALAGLALHRPHGGRATCLDHP
jgi:hypothetical protein